MPDKQNNWETCFDSITEFEDASTHKLLIPSIIKSGRVAEEVATNRSGGLYLNA